MQLIYDLYWWDTDFGDGNSGSRRIVQEIPMKIIWKTGFVRLILVAGILWMLLILVTLLFQVWSCRSSISFISGISRR